MPAQVEDILALSGGGRTVEMLVRRETTRSFLQKVRTSLH